MHRYVPSRADTSASLQALREGIGALATAPGDFPTLIGDLKVFRRDTPTPPMNCTVEPSVVLVVQGAKQMVIGGDSHPYDQSRFLITSLDMPAHSAVTQASEQHPCLGLVLKLDLRTLAELIAQDSRLPLVGRSAQGSMGVGSLCPRILASFTRLVDLVHEPQAVRALWPLLQREIHYRLLMSEQARLLWRIASVGSKTQRIAKAIEWIKANYAAALRVEELATQVQMGLSTFHQHFRRLTAMSPLQYQKWIRLNEARRLMLNEQMTAATAAFRVGYESPSQFSREYRRQFGVPPRQDIAGLRRGPASA